MFAFSRACTSTLSCALPRPLATQLDRDLRESYRGHPHFEDTARFCALYDQAAFDGAYDSAPLDFFETMVRRVFERPVNSIYVS